MASKRQLEANRLNARRSTGPKSVLGKAHTRMNAVKHGLTAESIIIGDEDPQDFETLRTELEQDFEPESRIEYELIDRLASLLWRLRRVPSVEAALAKIREREITQQVRADIQAKEWEAYGDRLSAESRQRFEASCGNDEDVIYRITMSAGYSSRIKKIQEEVRAELPAPDCRAEQEQAQSRIRGTGLLILFRDIENGDLLSKLGRYEASLMNAATRVLQHLHFLRAERKGNRVIDV